MRAIRVHEHGGPDVLRLEEVPDPTPAPGDVLVRLRAAGVNPVDTYMRAGTRGYGPELPFVLGLDGAGVVEDVRGSVEGVAEGDRVFVAAHGGTYAEFVSVPAWRARPLPEDVGFREGACLGVPCSTAYRALFQRASIRAGETVLVHGASGGVGTAAVQLALAHGCRVVGTAGTPTGESLLRSLGVEDVVDHADPDHLDRLTRLVGERGVDVVLEMAAGTNLGDVLPHLAEGGRVVVVGSRGRVEIAPRDLMRREASILGMSLIAAPREALEECFSGVEAALRTGCLRPMVRAAFGLAEGGRAHELLAEGGAAGQIVLDV